MLCDFSCPHLEGAGLALSLAVNYSSKVASSVSMSRLESHLPTHNELQIWTSGGSLVSRTGERRAPYDTASISCKRELKREREEK